VTKVGKKDDSDSEEENRKEDDDSDKKDAVKLHITEDKPDPEAPNTNKYFSNVTFQNMNLSE
jgi:hypothetical protein